MEEGKKVTKKALYEEIRFFKKEIKRQFADQEWIPSYVLSLIDGIDDRFRKIRAKGESKSDRNQGWLWTQMKSDVHREYDKRMGLFQ